MEAVYNGLFSFSFEVAEEAEEENVLIVALYASWEGCEGKVTPDNSSSSLPFLATTASAKAISSWSEEGAPSPPPHCSFLVVFIVIVVVVAVVSVILSLSLFSVKAFC